MKPPLSWNRSFDNIEQKMKFPEKRGAATVSATKKYTTRRVVPDSWENFYFSRLNEQQLFNPGQ